MDIDFTIERYKFTEKTTTGRLYLLDKLQCFILEDKTRAKDEVHIKGETCIPTGIYQVTLRKEGSIYNDYIHRFKNSNIGQERGMLHIHNLDGQKYDNWYTSPGVNADACVMIHIGNYAKDTLGCPLVGEAPGYDEIISSTKAYLSAYPKMADVVEKKGYAILEIKNI